MDAPLPAMASPSVSRPSAADVWAGLAAMLVAVPSALAFGVAVYSAAHPSLAGAGALAGMAGAIALGITAPLVSRNTGFITAPCAPAAAVLAGLAAGLADSGELAPVRILALLALTGLVAAALQVGFGAMRLGRLIKYIPYQVVTGYLSGVAVIIASSQLPKLLGAPPDSRLPAVLSDPTLWSWQAIVVGAATIAAMLAARRFAQRVPAPILALAAGVLAYFVLALFDARLLGVAGNPLRVGPLGASGSLLEAATVRANGVFAIDRHDIALVLASALTLAVLLSIDTLKTGLVLDAMLRRRHDSNRELLGQGIANLASFAVGGMPGAGTMGATLVNVTSGARTWWSGVAAGGFALLALFVFGDLIAWLPIPALAGILLVIAWRMFDFGMFRLLAHRGTMLDFAIIATVVVVAQFYGLIEAALAGVALAIMLFIRDQAGTSVILRKRDLAVTRSKRRRPESEAEVLAEHGAQGLLVELKDNLFFGTTDQLLTELDAELARRRFVLLDLRRVASMDYTAAHLFDQMRHRLKERGGALLLCGMPSQRASRQDIHRYLDQVGLIQGAGLEVYETRDAALEAMEARILEAAGRAAAADDGELPLSELPLLQGLDGPVLDQLARCVEVRTLRAGEVLCRRGAEGDELFMVRRGVMHIRLPLEGGKHHHLATFGRGEPFGELSFLDRMPRSADAVAATDVSLYVLPRARFDALAREQPQVAGVLFERIASVIAHRLRLVDGELRELEDR